MIQCIRNAICLFLQQGLFPQGEFKAMLKFIILPSSLKQQIHFMYLLRREIGYYGLFCVNGGKWWQGKHTDIFGHQYSVFPHSFQTCLCTYRNIRWNSPSPGVLLPKPFLEMISGSRLWRCRLMDIAGLGDVFSVCQNVKVQRWSGVQKWLRTEGVSFYRMLWQVPEQVWKQCGKIEDSCPKTGRRVPFSFPLTCTQVQKNLKTLTLWLPLAIFFHLIPENIQIKMYIIIYLRRYNYSYCFVWVWNLMPHVKGIIQTEGAW
jgi:hypothetical protein